MTTHWNHKGSQGRRPVARSMGWILLLAIATGTAWAQEKPAPIAPEFLPKDSILLVQCRAWSEWAQAWNKTSLSKIAQEAEIQAFLAGPLGKLRLLLSGAAAAGIPAAAGPGWVDNTLNTLNAIFPGPIVLALRKPVGAGQPPERRIPDAVLVLGTVDASSAAQLIQGVLGTILQQWKIEFLKQEPYQNAILSTLNLKPFTLTFTLLGKHLILATDQGLCKQVIDGFAGTLPERLSDNASFKSCGLTGLEHSGAYLNLAALREILGAEKGEGLQPLKKILSQIGLEGTESLSWSLQMNGAAFESRAHLQFSGPRTGNLANIGTKAIDPALLGICPASSPIALGFSLQEGQLWQTYRTLTQARGKSRQSEMIDSVEKKFATLNRNLEKEIAEAFGSQVVLTLAPNESSIPLNPFRDLVGCLAVRDAAKATKVLTEVLALAASERYKGSDPKTLLKSQTVEGVEVHYVEPPAGGDPQAGEDGGPRFTAFYAIRENRMVTTLNILTMRSVLRAGKNPTLLENQAFQDALVTSGGTLGSLFTYVDRGQVYAIAFKLGSAALERLAPRDFLAAAGINLNLLPSPQSITKHLFPTLTVVKATEKGIGMSSRGPLPSLEVLAAPATALAAIIATLTADLASPEPAPAPAATNQGPGKPAGQGNQPAPQGAR